LGEEVIVCIGFPFLPLAEEWVCGGYDWLGDHVRGFLCHWQRNRFIGSGEFLFIISHTQSSCG
jgi:hypothetical protein